MLIVDPAFVPNNGIISKISKNFTGTLASALTSASVTSSFSWPLFGEEEVASASPHKKTTIEEYTKAKGGNHIIEKILITNSGVITTHNILALRQ